MSEAEQNAYCDGFDAGQNEATAVVADLRAQLELERYNVEKTAQEGAKRLKDAEAREDTYYQAARAAYLTLREAREQLIRLRDSGAELPDTQRLIDKIWNVTNFDGYPEPRA